MRRKIQLCKVSKMLLGGDIVSTSGISLLSKAAKVLLLSGNKNHSAPLFSFRSVAYAKIFAGAVVVGRSVSCLLMSVGKSQVFTSVVGFVPVDMINSFGRPFPDHYGDCGSMGVNSDSVDNASHVTAFRFGEKRRFAGISRVPAFLRLSCRPSGIVRKMVNWARFPNKHPGFRVILDRFAQRKNWDTHGQFVRLKRVHCQGAG